MLPTVRCLTVGRGADVLVPEARLVQNHLYACGTATTFGTWLCDADSMHNISAWA
jgi:hypothetical protein